MVQVPRKTFAEIKRMLARRDERKAKAKEKRKLLGIKALRLPKLGALNEKLDHLFSLVIRRRDAKITGGACRFAAKLGCGGRIECCFHFVRKSRSLKLRFDLRNAVGACFACNGYMEHNEGPYWTWYAGEFGVEAMEQLQRDSHGRADWSREDYEKIEAELKKTLEQEP